MSTYIQHHSNVMLHKLLAHYLLLHYHSQVFNCQAGVSLNWELKLKEELFLEYRAFGNHSNAFSRSCSMVSEALLSVSTTIFLTVFKYSTGTIIFLL